MAVENWFCVIWLPVVPPAPLLLPTAGLIILAGDPEEGREKDPRAPGKVGKAEVPLLMGFTFPLFPRVRPDTEEDKPTSWSSWKLKWRF